MSNFSDGLPPDDPTIAGIPAETMFLLSHTPFSSAANWLS